MGYWNQGEELNNGKYVVEKLLGSGGFGVTYKIKHTRNNKLFALKTLNIEAQNRSDFEQLQVKFINEAIALASCRHPHIVRVYPQVFQQNGLWCMVMEYIEGEDLADYLDEHGKFSEKDAIIIITKVGKALSYVHQQGFLHRDIKPANILLRKADLSPVLIDFGLAREYTPGTIRSMTNSKTERYAPIEQYQRNGNFGAWTDVYALAATLYALLTERPPVPSDVRKEVAANILITPKQHNPEISNRTNEGILKGMEIEPGDRPKSVEEWLVTITRTKKFSNIELIPSSEKTDIAKPLLIIDKKISTTWNESPENIVVYEDITLASLKIEDLKLRKIVWDDVEWVEPQELFLSELIFIDWEDSFPGGLSVKETEPLTFNGERITPLIPLNPILLDYFTPEDLIENIYFQPINSGSGVRVILDLPLAGMSCSQTSESYRSVKDYLLKPENALDAVPVLEIFPNFRANCWQEYYAIYYDCEYGQDTFNVDLLQAIELETFKEGFGSFKLARFSEFPTYIQCTNSYHQNIGLIILPTPILRSKKEKWIVGVDFGSSYTNIYVNCNDKIAPLHLKNLLHQVTETSNENRLNLLFENFIPINFLPVENPLPLHSILTNRNSFRDNETMRPFFDGRMYCPNFGHFESDDWMKTELKWSIANLDCKKAFIKHLALYITALAANEGINEIQWSFSYPSAFSHGDRNYYSRIWQDIAIDLQKTTGITHFCPKISDLKYVKTESLAIAQYFCDRERHNFKNTTCIDIGSHTSDISIWENNSLVYQCSVQLAGIDLFSNLMRINLTGSCTLLVNRKTGDR